MVLQLTIVISVLIVIICLVFINTKKLKQQKLRQIQQEWIGESIGRKSDLAESIESYWKQLDQDNFTCIDNITWNDLSMDKVYEKMNYTRTSLGAEKLYSILRNAEKEDRNVRKEEPFLQNIMKESSLREELQLLLMRMGKQNFSNSSHFLFQTQDKYMKHTFLYMALSILPLLSIFLLFISFQVFLFSMIICLALNGFIYYIHKRDYEKHFNSLSYVVSLISCGKALKKVKHPAFITKRNILESNLKKLGDISWLGSVISSNNGTNAEMVAEYIRAFFLVDFIAYNKIIRKLEKYRQEYTKLWHTISDLDALIAIAYFRQLQQHYCVPEFTEEMQLNGEEVYHPLVPNPVTNDITLQNNILITGSNASGKSTFIKTVAINCILAQTINTALATKFTLTPSHILTSIAVSDDVETGDSYFIAEIKSLKRIIDAINTGKSCFTFIDEILKGTNTIERISASSAILKWMSERKNNLSIVASHDLELTEITQTYFDNFHFHERIHNGEISFDYKLKQGPSITKNAIKLLANINFPDEIVEHSSKFADSFTESRKWHTFLDLKNNN